MPYSNLPQQSEQYEKFSPINRSPNNVVPNNILPNNRPGTKPNPFQDSIIIGNLRNYPIVSVVIVGGEWNNKQRTGVIVSESGHVLTYELRSKDCLVLYKDKLYKYKTVKELNQFIVLEPREKIDVTTYYPPIGNNELSGFNSATLRVIDRKGVSQMASFRRIPNTEDEWYTSDIAIANSKPCDLVINKDNQVVGLIGEVAGKYTKMRTVPNLDIENYVVPPPPKAAPVPEELKGDDPFPEEPLPAPTPTSPPAHEPTSPPAPKSTPPKPTLLSNEHYEVLIFKLVDGKVVSYGTRMYNNYNEIEQQLKLGGFIFKTKQPPVELSKLR